MKLPDLIKQRIVFPACLLLCFCFASAQNKYTLTGTVIDESGQALAFCNTVASGKTDSTLVFGGTTDTTGIFKIHLPAGLYNFKAMYLGYETHQQELTVNENMDVGNITLRLSAISLNEITVTPDMLRRNADGYVFTPGNNPVIQGKSTSELLNYLPGIWINRSNRSISINNKGGTRVMINDRLLHMSGEELYNYLENINAEDIKNIEVVSEPGASQDARFQGGILKINLKPNNIQGIKGSSGFAYGFQDDANTTPLTSNLNVEYRKNKFSLYSGIRYRSNKFYQENNETIQYYTGNQRKMENLFDGLSTTRNWTGRLGMMYDLSAKQSVGMDVDLTATKNHSANITQSTIRTADAVSEGYAQALSNQAQYRHTVSFNYKRKLDDKGSSLLIIGDYMFNNRDLQENDSIADISPEDVHLSFIDKQKRLTASKTNYYTLKTDYHQYFNERVSADAGMKYAYTNMNTHLDYLDEINGINEWNDHYLYREQVIAGYAVVKTNFGRLQANGGLRVEHTALRPYSYIDPDKNTNQDYADFFPSISLNYVINTQKNHTVSGGYNRHIQRPSFAELNPYKVPLNRYTFVTGNPDLKPAYTDNIYLTGVLSNKYSLSIGHSITKGYVSQIILQNPENPDILIYRYANMKKSTAYFASLTIPYNITKGWRSGLDFVWYYSRNELDSREFKGSLYQGRINNYFTLSSDWSAELNYMYNSGGVSGIWRFKSYNSLDMILKRTFFGKKLTATLTITNLLDDGGATMRGVSDQPGFILKTYHQRTGNMVRTYNLGLRYNFKMGKEIKVNQVARGNQEESKR